ncbi:cytochrome P450 2B5-like [Amphiura filiformis]|uniref:cytochrome P450 2B5-like n=1 Tax=Amphiura filiformis TaxID=82378 RepID=UPI003B218816
MPTNNKWDDMGPYRIFALACFRQFGVGTSRFEEPISKESTYLIEELANLKGQAVDLTWYFNNAVSNIICKVVFGTRFELSDERIHRLTSLLNRLNELLGAGGLEIFIPINIPSKAKQELNKVVDELHGFINEMIESHRKNFDTDNMNDVIDLWLNEIRLHKSEDPNSFRNSDNMTGQILLLFLAGTDTTSNTLRWGSQYLVRYPKVQDRIHHEIDTVVGRNRLPKLADKPNLPYTQAVIAELHRIISLVPLSAFHVAGDTTTFRGYTIPKNSVVISNLYAVMHSPEIWGDPEEFRPERFLDDEGNFHEPDEVIPFGVGRWNCLGEALARQELFIFFSHVLHQFKFEATSKDAQMPTLKPIDGVVTHPENIVYALYKGEPLHKFFVKLGNRYGQVFSFTALGIPVVVLNENQAIREAYQDTKLSDRGENKMQAKVYSPTWRRICLGEALVRQELFIFFTHLLHQFKFEKASKDAPMPSLEPIYGVVAHPEKYELRIVKRD